jgi:hypothetical protein
VDREVSPLVQQAYLIAAEELGAKPVICMIGLSELRGEFHEDPYP